MLKLLFIAVFGGLLLLAVIYNLASNGRGRSVPQLPFSDLLKETDSGKVTDIIVRGNEITGHFSDGRAFKAYAPFVPGLVDRFMTHGVRISAASTDDDIANYICWLFYGFAAFLLWHLIVRPLRAALAVLLRIEHILAARAVTDGYTRANPPSGGAPTGN